MFVANDKKGFGLVEVLVGTALLSVVLGGLIVLFSNFTRTASENVREVKAAFLLQEGAEVVRLWRDQGWSNISGLTTSQTYYPIFSTGRWATSSVPVLVDGIFERRIVVADTFRDINDDIVESSTTNDPNTKKITVSVGWAAGGGATSTKSVVFYLTNLFSR